MESITLFRLWKTGVVVVDEILRELVDVAHGWRTESERAQATG